MNNLNGKKFVASYSGGKDSVLAIYRAIRSKMIPVELITTYNTDKERTWFHGLTLNMLENVSKEINIPISTIQTSGEAYKKDFINKLRYYKKQGVEVCVFGDIDIQEHLNWCSEVCESSNIEPYFPLWKENRRELVYEFIELGFKTMITIIDNKKMSHEFIGRTLTKELVEKIEESGADICGENGEYHTFTYDGPLFKNAVKIVHEEIINIGNISVMPIDTIS